MSVETAETLPPPEPPPPRDPPATSRQETGAETPLTGDADQLLDQEKPLEAESRPAVQEAQEPNDAEQIEDLEATNTDTGDTTTGGNDQLLAGEQDLEAEPKSDDPATSANQETDENGLSQTSSASTVSPESAQDGAVGSKNDPAGDNDEETATGEITIPLGGSDKEIDKGTGETSDTDVTNEASQSESTDEDLTPNAANNNDLAADQEDADEAETRQALTGIQSQDESSVDNMRQKVASRDIGHNGGTPFGETSTAASGSADGQNLAVNKDQVIDNGFAQAVKPGTDTTNTSMQDESTIDDGTPNAATENKPVAGQENVSETGYHNIDLSSDTNTAAGAEPTDTDSIETESNEASHRVTEAESEQAPFEVQSEDKRSTAGVTVGSAETANRASITGQHVVDTAANAGADVTEEISENAARQAATDGSSGSHISDTLNGNDDIADMGTRRDQRAVNDLESRVPAPPKEPGDATLSNDSPVYHQERSTTIGYDSNTVIVASVIKPEDGFHDVVVHGNNKGYFQPGAVNAAGKDFSVGEVHPNHIADAIVGNPDYSGGPIRLISCHTGTVAVGSSEIPAAQAVADRLGVPVKAPTDEVGAYPQLGPSQEPVIFNDGHWNTFLPRGETL